MSNKPSQKKFQTAQGMKDILPEDAGTFRLIEGTARRVFEKYGYSEIRTPIMEQTDLFSRGIGETTDIVEKEMYTLQEDDLTLRPEGTAPVVRAYVQHSMHKEKAFRKFYYTGAFFRRERPQAGRLRQFHQVGLEALGSSDPLIDAEIIMAACEFLDTLGLSGWEVRLNSIGCSECRDGYRNVLKEALEPSMTALCENCKSRFDRNVFRVLDCKQDDIRRDGAAIECRINAEDPDNDFRPSPGPVTTFVPPGGAGVRWDSHVYQGYDIPSSDDSLIGKLVIHRPTRAEAIATARRALDEFVIYPTRTTIPLCQDILAHPKFQAGQWDTTYIEREMLKS